MVLLFSVVSVCGCICQHNNSRTVRDIIIRFLREQDMVRSSDEFENGCNRTYSGTWDVGVDLTSLMFWFSVCRCFGLSASDPSG